MKIPRLFILLCLILIVGTASAGFPQFTAGVGETFAKSQIIAEKYDGWVMPAGVEAINTVDIPIPLVDFKAAAPFMIGINPDDATGYVEVWHAGPIFYVRHTFRTPGPILNPNMIHGMAI